MRIFILGRTKYQEAWALMKRIHDEVASGVSEEMILVTEHDHVITVGRHGRLNNVLRRELPIYVVERGGDATYHGPGQAVVYPVVRLRGGVRSYLWALEEAVIRTLDKYGISAGRREDHRGVWVGGKKIASVGIAVERGVAYHGVAVYVNPHMEYFYHINPCGLPPSVITSMRQLGVEADVFEVGYAVAANLETLLQRQERLKTRCESLRRIP
ncbi:MULTISPECIES: lipoyl(octanoyl) transferase LipB [Pyrobaculum]|uniref:Probable octanoyltransferase n=3 Tax=Pyrobaculum TaxID=2276 RepID=LIPB_PYRAR|nr:lipoyl(octanoyl) transferase LipB [Pyrobaculum arsenaticum]A4WK37.1 RecName: Full=Probable octanoyltransferase; AltName: Full=Lipoate-protein ligase B; AltName: Full=Lipoyl/octanoyl transferase; AltName: Full=Octanoyl-[acyl-carrier-protein]-protein N-octanoyltransferase [Pyrobaculum arsenaticum DSM 13514]ABP50754.1 lipoate-protein ligase B [Pyrobaculum arsenaticum DSM 13514]MCY0891241.1 lipoyl(octanoyl) transferase LipB [Pyrobaculum arsenaticum]NYR15530.1 lipoyl(octanoyl) transferase LipB [P